MNSITGVWKLKSFKVTDSGGTKEPFGENPLGMLIFSPVEEDAAPYMGVQLTSQAGTDTGHSVSFSATYEVLGSDSYRFTPTATNDPEKFPVDVPTAPKSYEITSDDQVFTESWKENGKDIVVVWDRLHTAGH